MYDDLTVNVKVVKGQDAEEDAPNFLTDIIKLLKLPSEELEVSLLFFETHFSHECASIFHALTILLAAFFPPWAGFTALCRSSIIVDADSLKSGKQDINGCTSCGRQHTRGCLPLVQRAMRASVRG